MKILVDYEPATGQVVFADSSLVYHTPNLSLEEVGSGSIDVLELVKQGLTSDDLVKLKNMWII